MRVKNSKIAGKLNVPPSKSQTLRSILFGTLAQGKSVITNPLQSPDIQAMIQASASFGASISFDGEKIEIQGVGGKIDFAENVIDAGNSGIVLRFCTAVGALASHPVVVTGDWSIRHRRPMKPLLSALSELGVRTESMRGDHFAPVIVQGPIKSGVTTVVGEDSQHVSSLLIAGAFAKGDIEINVINPGELPWIGLTLDWLKMLQIPYQRQGFSKFCLKGNSRYPGFTYKVPGDLSSLAFPLAAALITDSDLCLKGVDMEDGQGDKELVKVFKEMGANIEIDPLSQSLYVKKGSCLKGLSLDVNPFIDALPILAVVACFAEGETRLYNGAIARKKESDRIFAMATELKKMGADIEELPDGLLISSSKLYGSKLYSHRDHRVCLSLAVASLASQGESLIEESGCIKKTYPTFIEDFKSIGANIDS